MDLLHLKYFLEVARQKSFTLASKSIHVGQPTISKMVKSMEEELGVTLFDRSAKQIELTDAGQVIFKEAQHLVKSFQNINFELTELMGLKRGHIKIGLPPMVGAKFFPKIIAAFHNRYPEIVLELIDDGANKVENDVENGNLDIGVALLPVNKEIFDYYSFVKENLMLLVHPEHPLASKPEIKLINLRKEPFIFFQKDFALHDRIYEACIKSGFQPKIIYKSSQWDFISEMVAANLGVAMLPETICKELDNKRIKSIPLVKPTIGWNLAMIWRKDKYLSYATRKWIDFTRSLFKKDQVI